jgi:hypothetical protein
MKRLSEDYDRAVKVSLVLHVVCLSVSGLLLDDGQLAQWCGVSLVAYWSAYTVIAVRRPQTPTKLDLFLIRWGYPALCFSITPFLMILIWKLRGVWP